MIEKWLSYSLHDLLIFSPESYYRLHELYNLSLWPLQVLSFLLFCLALYLNIKGHRYYPKAILIGLSLAWLLNGFWFVSQFYVQINPLANTLTYAFYLQAILLMLMAVFVSHAGGGPGPSGIRAVSGWSLLMYAGFVHPVALFLLGRKFGGLEIVGIAPDPTALATLGILIMLKKRVYWLAMIVPSLWITLSILTYLSFET